MPYGIVALKPRLFPVSIVGPNSFIALIIKMSFVNCLHIIIQFDVYVCSHAHLLCVCMFFRETPFWKRVKLSQIFLKQTVMVIIEDARLYSV